jgi:hypothetical protein
MSTPMTEAHLELVKTALFSRDAAGRLLTAPMAAQLIAGCEAAAVQTAMLREYGNLCATNESLAKERDQLRAEIARLDAEKPWLKEANATNADLRAEVERLTKLRELALSDAPDQWTKEIDAAHPMETDSYGRYEIAMKMVGNRHGKYELVDLVNWLLKCADDAKAERLRSDRDCEKRMRISELAIAAQKSTDYYCNESTLQPSEEDWRIDGTEEHKLWNAMESDIAALRAAIDAAMKEGA